MLDETKKKKWKKRGENANFKKEPKRTFGTEKHFICKSRECFFDYIHIYKKLKGIYKLLKLACEFRYKVNLQKSTVFLYIRSKHLENKHFKNLICNNIKTHQIPRNKFNLKNVH